MNHIIFAFMLLIAVPTQGLATDANEVLHVLDYSDLRSTADLEQQGISSVVDLPSDPIKFVYIMVTAWEGSIEDLHFVVMNYLDTIEFSGKSHLKKIIKRSREFESLPALRKAVASESGFGDRGKLYSIHVATQAAFRKFMAKIFCDEEDNFTYTRRFADKFKDKVMQTDCYSLYNLLSYRVRLRAISKYMVWQALCSDVSRGVFDQDFADRVKAILNNITNKQWLTDHQGEYERVIAQLEEKNETSILFRVIHSLEIDSFNRPLHFMPHAWCGANEKASYCVGVFVVVYLLVFGYLVHTHPAPAQ